MPGNRTTGAPGSKVLCAQRAAPWRARPRQNKRRRQAKPFAQATFRQLPGLRSRHDIDLTLHRCRNGDWPVNPSQDDTIGCGSADQRRQIGIFGHARRAPAGAQQHDAIGCCRLLRNSGIGRAEKQTRERQRYDRIAANKPGNDSRQCPHATLISKLHLFVNAWGYRCADQ